MESFTRTSEKNIRQIFTESTGVSVPQSRRLKGHGTLIVLLAVLILAVSTVTVAATTGLGNFVFVIGTEQMFNMDAIEIKEIDEASTAEYAKAQGRGPYYAAPEGVDYDDDHNPIGSSDHSVTHLALFYDVDTFTNVTGLEIIGLDRLFGQVDWTKRYHSPDEQCIMLDIWNRKGIGMVIFDADVDEIPMHAIGYFAIPGYNEETGIGFGRKTLFPTVYNYAEGKKAYIVEGSTSYTAYFTEGGIMYQLSAERSDGAKEALKKAIRIMAGIE